ncbi:hypothetical protein Dimus_034860 [Dionaea muscipula]
MIKMKKTVLIQISIDSIKIIISHHLPFCCHLHEKQMGRLFIYLIVLRIIVMRIRYPYPVICFYLLVKPPMATASNVCARHCHVNYEEIKKGESAKEEIKAEKARERKQNRRND